MSVGATLTATALIVGFAGVLSGMEGYAGRQEMRSGGLLDVSIAARGRSLLPGWSPPTNWVATVWLSLLASSTLLLVSVGAGLNHVFTVSLLGVALCVTLQSALLPYGRDGSDEAALIVTVPLAVACAFGASGGGVRLALAFIAAELALSYLAAGGAKLGGRYWRDGTALTRIARTASYGHPAVAAGLARRPVLGQVATWGLVGWELTIPVALVLGGSPAVITLALGAIFHGITAYTVGLNRFVPWFLAAYPSALYVSLHYGVLH